MPITHLAAEMLSLTEQEKPRGQESNDTAFHAYGACSSFFRESCLAVLDDGFWPMFAGRVSAHGDRKGKGSSREWCRILLREIEFTEASSAVVCRCASECRASTPDKPRKKIASGRSAVDVAVLATPAARPLLVKSVAPKELSCRVPVALANKQLPFPLSIRSAR